MLLRWTLWEDADGNLPIQMSLALLTDDWDPLTERTLPCGPFHTAEDRRHELLDDVRRFLRTHGHQLELQL